MVFRFYYIGIKGWRNLQTTNKKEEKLEAKICSKTSLACSKSYVDSLAPFDSNIINQKEDSYAKK